MSVLGMSVFGMLSIWHAQYLECQYLGCWCLGCQCLGCQYLGCSVCGMLCVRDVLCLGCQCSGYQCLGCQNAHGLWQQMEAVGWQMASPSSGSSRMLSAGSSSRVPLHSSAQNSGAGKELIPTLVGRWEPDLFLAWLWERSLQGVWISRLLWSWIPGAVKVLSWRDRGGNLRS